MHDRIRGSPEWDKVRSMLCDVPYGLRSLSIVIYQDLSDSRPSKTGERLERVDDNGIELLDLVLAGETFASLCEVVFKVKRRAPRSPVAHELISMGMQHPLSHELIWRSIRERLPRLHGRGIVKLVVIGPSY